MLRVSVCMATYNGAAFITDQLKSILEQIDAQDEVVIVDDCSRDNTIELVNKLADSRIRIVRNPVNSGHVYTFCRALGMARNELIFMSDQDDLWAKDRVQMMTNEILQSSALLVTTNMAFMDSEGNTIAYPDIVGVRATDSRRYSKNILDIFRGVTNYYGCTMLIRRELLDLVLPCPVSVESHDLWIAMAANVCGRNSHMEYISLIRRIHGANASITSRGLLPRLWSRIIFCQSFLILFKRFRGWGKTHGIRKQ